MSSALCANCNRELSGKYCSNCGQKAETHRLNWHFLWHDLQHGLIHFDKGVAFTLKELSTRPGYSIKEFLEGKRVNHFKPISLVVLLGGVFAFLYHSSHIRFPAMITKNDKGALELLDWVFTHFSVMELINIPLTAAATTFVFRKYGYNFIEHFVINTFISAQRLTVCILLFPILVIYSGTSQLFSYFIIVGIANIIFLFWTYKQIFSTASFFEIYLKIQATLLIAVAFGLVISYIVGVITGNPTIRF